MFRRFSVNFALFSIALDMLLVAAGLFGASQARAPLGELLTFLRDINEPVVLPWELYLLFPFLWVVILQVFAVYDGRKNLRISAELGSLTIGSMLAAVALAGVLYLSYRDVSRFLFLMSCGIAFCLMAGWRLVARLLFQRSGLHAQRRRVLIMGAGVVGRQLAEQLKRSPQFGLDLAGFLDDDWKKQADHADILGSLDIARTLTRERAIEDVVIALPRSAHQRLNEVAAMLHDLPVRVWVIPDYFSLTLHRASVEDFAGIPMLDLRAPALSEYQRMTKRAFDLLVSVLALPAALPVMGLAALAIRLEGPGPILYNAERVGENGRLFHMHKFRSMVPDADRLQPLVQQRAQNGAVLHKRPDDPRVTRVGRVLRRTSIDELPQLFNVLKGEMSLVGPRPEIPGLVERYDPWQRKRFAVPQGLTGWWQINGRSDKPMHLHTEDDLYYVQHYSIWLDLQILVRTVWVVLRSRGAF
jgi:exopolysaccharide biosynthesis polyprenyl glycosylphosphotransferase